MANFTGVITSELRTATVESLVDLTAKNYTLVAMSTSVSNRVVVATGSTVPMYVLVDGGVTAGTTTAPVAVTIVEAGETKVKLAAGCNPGDYLTSDGAGLAIPTTTGGAKYFGIAQEKRNSGDLVRVSITRGNY